MDLAGMSAMLNQAKVQQAASLSVMKMAMGNAEQTGRAMTEMLKGSTPRIERVSPSHLGNKIDVRL